MKKQPEITEQTRQNFVQAFLALNEQKEIHKITIRELCQQAGYNRSTFYQYFSDIYTLRNIIEENIIFEIHILFKTHLTNALKRKNLDVFMDFYSEHEKIFFVLLGKNGSQIFHEKIKNTVKSNLREIFNISALTLEQEYLMEFTVSAMMSTLIYWFENNKSMPQETLSDLLFNIITVCIVPNFQTN